jgi:hypothetical protein
MTSTLMKTLARGVAIQKALVIGLLLAAAPLAAVSGAPSAGHGGCGGEAPERGAYPTFCGIPATPRDVRPATAFKSQVVETRLAGRRVLRDTAPATFGLPEGQAEAFARSALAAVAPAETLSAPTDTEVFVEKARRQVVPPPLPPRPAAPPPQ